MKRATVEPPMVKPTLTTIRVKMLQEALPTPIKNARSRVPVPDLMRSRLQVMTALGWQHHVLSRKIWENSMFTWRITDRGQKTISLGEAARVRRLLDSCAKVKPLPDGQCGGERKIHTGAIRIELADLFIDSERMRKLAEASGRKLSNVYHAVEDAINATTRKHHVNVVVLAILVYDPVCHAAILEDPVLSSEWHRVWKERCF